MADARRAAALDVEVQARRTAAPARLGRVARAEGEDLLQQVERAADLLRVGVRPEVRAVAAVALAREVHARKRLVERDREKRIGLVVAQANVEARLVLLDELVLRQQRLGLGGDEQALDLVDARHHLDRAARRARALGVREVPGHALADRFRLADVDDLARLVAKEVDTGAVGQAAPLLGEPARAGFGRRRGHAFEDRSGGGGDRAAFGCAPGIGSTDRVVVHATTCWL